MYFTPHLQSDCFLEKEEPWRSLSTAQSQTWIVSLFFFSPFHPLLRHVRSEISESPAVLPVPEPPASSPELAGTIQPLREPFLLVLCSQHNRRLNSHSSNSAVDESSSLLSAGMIKDEMASLISNEVAAGPLRQPQIGTRKQSPKQGLSQKTQPFVQLLHKLSIASKPETNLNLSACRDSDWLLHMPMEDKTLRGSVTILAPNCVKFLMFSSWESSRVNTSVLTDHNGSD